MAAMNKKNGVMRRIIFVVLIKSKNNLELNGILPLTILDFMYLLVICDWSDER